MRNNYNQKKILKGLEGLIELDGFIKEEIEDQFADVYPGHILTYAEKYYPIGPGFCELANATLEATGYIFRYNLIIEDETTSETIEFRADDEFQKWMEEQVTRLQAEKIKHGNKNFWKNWKLSHSAKSVLKEFNALEERVLCLADGLDGKEPMSTLQIAQLPEFSCKEIYISAVLNYVRKNIAKKIKTENFKQICEEQRTKY